MAEEKLPLYACARIWAGVSFSCLCGEVFWFMREGFPIYADNFYCPQLWVVQPTIMGYTTHSYGLYNP